MARPRQKEIPKDYPLKTAYRRFHHKAFALWMLGMTFRDISRKIHVTTVQICRWARVEDWDALARNALPLVKQKVVEETAADVATIQAQHARDARALRERAVGMLEGFPIKSYITQDGDKVTITGYPSPSDLRLLVGAYKEASDLELLRLGEDAPQGRFDLTFPDFGQMLEKIWQSRRRELPPGDRRDAAPPSGAVLTELSGRSRPVPVVNENG